MDKETLVKIETTAGDIKVKLYNETPKHRDKNDIVNNINVIFFITLLFNLSLQIYHFRLNHLTFVT